MGIGINKVDEHMEGFMTKWMNLEEFMTKWMNQVEKRVDADPPFMIRSH